MNGMSVESTTKVETKDSTSISTRSKTIPAPNSGLRDAR